MTQKSRVEFTRYETNPEWDTLTVKQRWSEWEFSLCTNMEVEVCCTTNENSVSLFLKQTELRQLVEFLQSKLVE